MTAARSESRYATPDQPGAIECTPIYGVSTGVRIWAYGAAGAVLLYVGYLLGGTR